MTTDGSTPDFPFLLLVCSRGTVHHSGIDDLTGGIALAEMMYEKGYCSRLRDIIRDEDICGGSGYSDCPAQHCWENMACGPVNSQFWRDNI